MAINEPVFEQLKLLANRLNNDEYDDIVQLLFNLYMGVDVGYDREDVISILADAKQAKNVAKQEKLQSFKLIKGGNDETKQIQLQSEYK